MFSFVVKTVSVMEDNEFRNMHDICRLCLRNNGTIIPIFGRENSSRDCVPLCKKIFACVSIEVKDEGDLPKMICVSCVHHIDSWCRFKETCDDSQKKLGYWLLEESTPSSNETKFSPGSELRNISEVVVVSESSDNDDDDEDEDEDEDEDDTAAADEDDDDNNIEIGIRNDDEVIILDSDDDSPEQVSNENSYISSNKQVLDSETVTITKKHAENTDEEKHMLCDKHVENTDSDKPVENTDNDKPVENSDCDKPVANTDSDKPGANTDSDKNSSVNDMQKCAFNGVEGDVLNETLQTTENETDLKLTGPVENRNILKTILMFDGAVCNSESRSSDTDSRVLLSNQTTIDSSPSDGKSVNNESCDKQLVPSTDNVKKITCGENSDSQHKLTDANSKTVCNQENRDSQKNSCTDTSYQNTNLVIEGITTLTEKEGTVFSESSNTDCELTVQSSLLRSISNRTWEDDDVGIHRQSNNSDHVVVNCEPDYPTSSVVDISAVDIKEEPLDEDEILVEEDPINFASFFIKKEPNDWSANNETEEQNIDEVRSDDTLCNQNIPPKVLNSGELFCEPCQSTQSKFSNWVRHCRTRLHKRRTKSDGVVENSASRLIEDDSQTQTFQCHLCPCAFGYQQNLKRHIRDKHDPNSLSQNFVSNGDYICSQCPKSFDSTKALRGHMLFAHSDSRYCTCEKCKLELPSLSSLLTHKRSCGKRGFVTKRCTRCSKVFTTSKLFFKHLKFCKQTFYKENNTTNQPTKHVNSPPQTGVPRSKGLACTLCDISFQQYSTLVKHMNMYHFGYSESKYDNEVSADANKGNSSADNNEFSCKYCPQSFSSKKAYVNHVTQHVRKQEFDCKFCGYQSSSKQMFRHHVKTVHFSQFGQNFLCWICFTAFGTKSEFNTHKLQHKKVEKIKIYSCNICNNSFSSVSAIAKHKRIIHGDESAFAEHDSEVTKNLNNIEHSRFNTQCKICKKTYSTVGNLNRHVLLHKKKLTAVSSVGGIHRCIDCFKVYSSATGLNFHKKFCKKKSKLLFTSNYKIAVPPYHASLTKNGRVKCNKCDRMFASNAILYKHKFLKRCPLYPIERYGKNISCVNCNKQFPSSISLRRHCKNCSSSDGRNCLLCGEVFSSVFVLSEHTSVCSGTQLKCTLCNILLPSIEELREHKRTCSLHVTPNGRTANILHCTHCRKEFKYSKCYKEHEIKCASTSKKCLNCHRKFTSSTEFQKHKLSCCINLELNSNNANAVSSDQNVPDHEYCKCSVCNESFSTLENFENHPCQVQPEIKLEPPNEAYNCDLCLQQFSSMSYLNRHMRYNHSNHQKDFKVDERKRYICPLCPNIKFHKQEGYLEHIEKHKDKPNLDSLMNHGEKLTCELCDQQFTDETVYQQHMEDHISPSGNIESEQFRCDLCDKLFTTYKSVLSHRAGHFKGKNFSEETTSFSSISDTIKRTQFRCDLCNKQFGSYKSVISHRAGHFRTKALNKLELTDMHKKVDKLKIKHVRCKVCDKLLSIHSMKKHKKIHMREEYSLNQAAAVTDYYSENNESGPGLDKANCIPTLFQCIDCGKSFKYRKMLIEHMRVHLLVDQNKLESGSFNDEASNSTLTSSSGEAYYCKYCDLSWRHKSNYLRHIITKKHKILEAQFSNDV